MAVEQEDLQGMRTRIGLVQSSQLFEGGSILPDHSGALQCIPIALTLEETADDVLDRLQQLGEQSDRQRRNILTTSEKRLSSQDIKKLNPT